MKIEKVAAALRDAKETICSSLDEYVVNPGRDFKRAPRKISPQELFNYLITEGGKSTKNEIVDVGINIEDPPTAGALVRAREKLKPEAVEAVFHEFNKATHQPLPESAYGYRRLAFDGTRIIFPSDHRYAGEEYFIQTQPGIRGTYCLHTSALFDLTTHTYQWGTIEPIRGYSEKNAFLKCIDEYKGPEREKPLFIADRNFESYNIIAHLIENGQYFIIRAKDPSSNGLLKDIELPDSDCWDITITIEITRSKAKDVKTSERYVRCLNSRRRFDYLEPKSKETYKISFRAVRIRLKDGNYVCLLTNLPTEEFPPEALAQEYDLRWGEETAFRQWKYTVGVLNFHSAKPELIQQEIWAAMILYNVTELMAQGAVTMKADSTDLDKPEYKETHYKANFDVCVYLCRKYLRNTRRQNADMEKHLHWMQVQICRQLVPIRPDRRYPRHMMKRVRKAKYFTYRVA